MSSYLTTACDRVRRTHELTMIRVRISLIVTETAEIVAAFIAARAPRTAMRTRRSEAVEIKVAIFSRRALCDGSLQCPACHRIGNGASDGTPTSAADTAVHERYTQPIGRLVVGRQQLGATRSAAAMIECIPRRVASPSGVASVPSKDGQPRGLSMILATPRQEPSMSG
jgi:hypothetical protein